MASKKRLAIISGAAAALLAVSGGGIYLLSSGNDGTEFTQEDTVKVKKSDLESSITASGSIAPQREVALSTSLTGPIARLDAKVGQRVERGQLVASIDVSSTKRELQAQRAAQNAQSIGDVNQVEQAQLQLNQLREQLDKGMHPGINAAESGVRQAQEAYDSARADANFSGGEEVAQARAALEQARTALITANSQSLQAGFSTLGATGEPGVDPSAYAVSLLSFSDSTTAVQDAQRQLQEAEQALNRAVARQDQTAADKERTAQSAWGALADAQRALEAAQLSTAQELDTQTKAVNSALESAAASRASQQASLDKMEQDMQGADITSPIAGIITKVDGQQGQAATGPIVTVADDSTKILKVTVKEADLAKLKVGDEVTFTSPATAKKTFEGKVDFISPVAEATEETAEKKKKEFAVDIKVQGNAPELPLGASAKAKIITSLTKDVLSVPRSAIFEKDGKSYVLIVDNGKVQEREVKVGETSNFYVSIAEGVKSGDTILKQASPHSSNKQPGA